MHAILDFQPFAKDGEHYEFCILLQGEPRGDNGNISSLEEES